MESLEHRCLVLKRFKDLFMSSIAARPPRSSPDLIQRSMMFIRMYDCTKELDCFVGCASSQCTDFDLISLGSHLALRISRS
jgi:hypothetical protein